MLSATAGRVLNAFLNTSRAAVLTKNAVCDVFLSYGVQAVPACAHQRGRLAGCEPALLRLLGLDLVDLILEVADLPLTLPDGCFGGCK